MDFGMDTTAQAALGEVGYSSIKSAGGSGISKEIKPMGNKYIEEAFAKAQSWFQGCRVLIGVDNLWAGKRWTG